MVGWWIACGLAGMAVLVGFAVAVFRARDTVATERKAVIQPVIRTLIGEDEYFVVTAGAAKNDEALVATRESGPWPPVPTCGGALLTTEVIREEIAAQYLGHSGFIPSADTLAAMVDLIPMPDPGRNPLVPAAVRGDRFLVFLPDHRGEWSKLVIVAGEMFSRRGIRHTPQDAQLLAARLARPTVQHGVATK